MIKHRFFFNTAYKTALFKEIKYIFFSAKLGRNVVEVTFAGWLGKVTVILCNVLIMKHRIVQLVTGETTSNHLVMFITTVINSYRLNNIVKRPQHYAKVLLFFILF